MKTNDVLLVGESVRAHLLVVVVVVVKGFPNQVLHRSLEPLVSTTRFTLSRCHRPYQAVKVVHPLDVDEEARAVLF